MPLPDIESTDPAAPPVFLQSGFRSAGTWLWSRFRAMPGILAYCEPLNEELAVVTASRIAALTQAALQLRHPSLSDPYFAEFAPLLNPDGTGVRGFRAEFGLSTYFELPPALAAPLTDYLAGLIAHARRAGRQPVLKFARALGRAGWLRTAFPAAKQVLVLRDPLEQFLSGLDLARQYGNRTFLMIPLFAISRRSAGPLRRVCEVIGVPAIPATEDLGACIGAYVAMTESLPMRSLFGAFLAMFIVSHARSTPFADLVIDTRPLAGDGRYRSRIEAALQALSGQPVSLADFATAPRPDAASAEDAAYREAVEDISAILAPEYSESVAFVRERLPPRMVA